MSSLNRAMLIGRVGKDVEVRTTDNSKVASFTLATSERFKDRNGEVKEQTEWHNIVAWGKPAEVVEKYVRKGTSLFVEGPIQTRSWDDKQGVKRYTTEIRAFTIQLLERAAQAEQAAPAAQDDDDMPW